MCFTIVLPRDETQIHARAFQGPIVRAFEPMEELRRWLGGELRLNALLRDRGEGAATGRRSLCRFPLRIVPSRRRVVVSEYVATKRRRNGDISSEGEEDTSRCRNRLRQVSGRGREGRLRLAGEKIWQWPIGRR